MKPSTKLTLFVACSKIGVALVFVLLFPFLASQISNNFTDQSLQIQKNKVLNQIQKNGADYYLQGDSSYGSYTMLKEEYISLELAETYQPISNIKTEVRVVEQDTLNYKVLSYTFKHQGRPYLLEIGKTTDSIEKYYVPLQRLAIWALVILIAISALLDLSTARWLLGPFGKIIDTKLLKPKFPFDELPQKVSTSTSDFKQLDNQLISLMKQINTAFYKEREFTANASHEFMTPISVLQNKLDNFMLQPNLNQDSLEKLVSMSQSLQRLKKISQSLLLISRIENQHFNKNEEVTPILLISSILEDLELIAQQKKVKFINNIPDTLVISKTNVDLLSQLFYNLIYNAIKFNKEGGSVFIEASHTTNQTLCISIVDTGIGISNEQIPFIFDRFRKFNQKSNNGYGLGLAIVKSIADYLDIEIDVISAQNKETTFNVIFKQFRYNKSD